MSYSALPVDFGSALPTLCTAAPWAWTYPESRRVISNCKLPIANCLSPIPHNRHFNLTPFSLTQEASQDWNKKIDPSFLGETKGSISNCFPDEGRVSFFHFPYASHLKLNTEMEAFFSSHIRPKITSSLILLDIDLNCYFPPPKIQPWAKNQH